MWSMLSYIFQLLGCISSQKTWTLFSWDGTGGHFFGVWHMDYVLNLSRLKYFNYNTKLFDYKGRVDLFLYRMLETEHSITQQTSSIFVA